MQDEQPRVETGPAAVPWTAAEIFLALFLIYGLWTTAAYQFLEGINFYRWFYGSDGPASSARRSLWAILLAFPFQAVTIPLLFYQLSGTRPSQLGLTTRRLGVNVLAGAVGALLLTPALLGLNVAVMLLYQRATGARPEEHPLTQLAGTPLRPAEWAALVFAAVVAAPVLEELIFRGALLRWFAKHPGGGHVAMGTSLALAVYFRRDAIRAAWPQRGGALAEALAPALFVLALVPFYLLAWWRKPKSTGKDSSAAVFGSAALFAIVHTFAWPSPVALFVLGLAQGGLALRSGSLVGPMVLHALFNATTCVLLLWQ